MRQKQDNMLELPEVIRLTQQNRANDEYEKSRSVKLCNRCVQLCTMFLGFCLFLFYIIKQEWMQQLYIINQEWMRQKLTNLSIIDGNKNNTLYNMYLLLYITCIYYQV